MEGIYKMISNIVFEVMSWKAEDERNTLRQRQAEGIAAAKAKGKSLGRPKVKLPDNFFNVYADWKSDRITATESMKLLGVKKATFYRAVKQYEVKNK